MAHTQGVWGLNLKPRQGSLHSLCKARCGSERCMGETLFLTYVPDSHKEHGEIPRPHRHCAETDDKPDHHRPYPDRDVEETFAGLVYSAN